MSIIRSLTLAAAFALAAFAASTSATAQEKKVRVIPLTPAASATPPACTPAAAEMKAALAACGKGEVKATPAHKRVVKHPSPRPRVVVRTVVKERVVYRDRPAPTRVRECEPMSWQTRTRDGRWYPARACVYPRYIEGVTLAACNHLSGYYRYPDINEQIFVDGRWVLYRTY